MNSYKVSSFVIIPWNFCKEKEFKWDFEIQFVTLHRKLEFAIQLSFLNFAITTLKNDKFLS